MTLYVLDTDVLSHYQRGHPIVCQHVAAHPLTELAITVITIDEQLGGWYSLLRNTTRRDHLAIAYQSLADNIPLLAKFTILAFPETAQIRFEQLVNSKAQRAKNGPAHRCDRA